MCSPEKGDCADNTTGHLFFMDEWNFIYVSHKRTTKLLIGVFLASILQPPDVTVGFRSWATTDAERKRLEPSHAVCMFWIYGDKAGEP